MVCLRPQLKSPVNLFFKFQRIICFPPHVLSTSLSKPKVLFRFYGSLKIEALVLEKMIQ